MMFSVSRADYTHYPVGVMGVSTKRAMINYFLPAVLDAVLDAILTPYFERL